MQADGELAILNSLAGGSTTTTPREHSCFSGALQLAGGGSGGSNSGADKPHHRQQGAGASPLANGDADSDAEAGGWKLRGRNYVVLRLLWRQVLQMATRLDCNAIGGNILSTQPKYHFVRLVTLRVAYFGSMHQLTTLVAFFPQQASDLAMRTTVAAGGKKGAACSHRSRSSGHQTTMATIYRQVHSRTKLLLYQSVSRVAIWRRCVYHAVLPPAIPPSRVRRWLRPWRRPVSRGGSWGPRPGAVLQGKARRDHARL